MDLLNNIIALQQLVANIKYAIVSLVILVLACLIFDTYIW